MQNYRIAEAWTALEEDCIAFCYRPKNAPIAINKFKVFHAEA
jgi:hypothetical protein